MRSASVRCGDEAQSVPSAVLGVAEHALQYMLVFEVFAYWR